MDVIWFNGYLMELYIFWQIRLLSRITQNKHICSFVRVWVSVSVCVYMCMYMDVLRRKLFAQQQSGGMSSWCNG